MQGQHASIVLPSWFNVFGFILFEILRPMNAPQSSWAIFITQPTSLLYPNPLAKHEGLPTHSPLMVLEAEASLGQDEMYVQVQGMLSTYDPDASSESAFAQAAMLAPDMSDCPLLLEV